MDGLCKRNISCGNNQGESDGKDRIRRIREEDWSKRRKKMIFERLAKTRFSKQPKQDTINKYLNQEVLMNDQMESQDIQMEEEILQEVTVEKGYARVDQHYKKTKKISKKRCWICGSHNHLKMNCNRIRCFYCGRPGHIKANCYKKKIDFIYARLRESYKKNDKDEEKRRKHKQRIKQRKLELKIIEYRAKFLSDKLEKTERGDKFFIYWKNLKLGEYKGIGLPQTMIKPLQEHQFEKKLIFKLLRKATPLNKFPLYEGLTNYCGCGEIDLGRTVFINHIKKNAKTLSKKIHN